jgi:hypothetical protein
MKITQTVIEKYFAITHKKKTYHIDFISSNEPIMLGNMAGRRPRRVKRIQKHNKETNRKERKALQ